MTQTDVKAAVADLTERDTVIDTSGLPASSVMCLDLPPPPVIPIMAKTRRSRCVAEAFAVAASTSDGAIEVIVEPSERPEGLS